MNSPRNTPSYSVIEEEDTTQVLPHAHTKKPLKVNEVLETPPYSPQEPFYAPNALRSMPQMLGNVE